MSLSILVCLFIIGMVRALIYLGTYVEWFMLLSTYLGIYEPTCQMTDMSACRRIYQIVYSGTYTCYGLSIYCPMSDFSKKIVRAKNKKQSEPLFGLKKQYNYLQQTNVLQQ